MSTRNTVLALALTALSLASACATSQTAGAPPATLSVAGGSNSAPAALPDSSERGVRSTEIGARRDRATSLRETAAHYTN